MILIFKTNFFGHQLLVSLDMFGLNTLILMLHRNSSILPASSSAKSVWERQLPTRPRRCAVTPARSVQGHEGQFPAPGLGARCRFGEATFGRVHRMGRDAPKAGIGPVPASVSGAGTGAFFMPVVFGPLGTAGSVAEPATGEQRPLRTGAEKLGNPGLFCGAAKRVDLSIFRP
jgi:hypothetical protein